jgi:hypothetical protein
VIGVSRVPVRIAIARNPFADVFPAVCHIRHNVAEAGFRREKPDQKAEITA